ncbi:ferrochelatase [Metallumcola ferriviriculae]|uniref:Coproporphyrin III ferrochelatase n=1 Tax=Metallumcola ferriviriculae TaxID=3039180 RepID=A0AAU0UPD2_9FIRM|nr:ferrochelatase [Desulfitibacteraceae bacterium MK1]
MQNKFGVLLMAFGGPDKPEAIEPFVSSLLGGKKLPPAAMEKIKERYRLIGGSSPLVKITKNQAQVLQKVLNIPVEVGLCYARPDIKKGISALIDLGVEKIIAVSLSPHYSRVSTGAYRNEVQRVMEEMKPPAEVVFARGWYDHPEAIKAYYERIKQALLQFPKKDRNDVEIIFSAHSLPTAYMAEGEPYVDELDATVRSLVQLLPGHQWHLAYQSKGGGKGDWLGPEVETVLDSLVQSGQANVLLVPLSFASDHVETLYDIDIIIKNHAKELGLNMQRSEALNDEPQFITALADIVQDIIQG